MLRKHFVSVFGEDVIKHLHSWYSCHHSLIVFKSLLGDSI